LVGWDRSIAEFVGPRRKGSTPELVDVTAAEGGELVWSLTRPAR
jgi:hypothetical protein